MTTGKVVGGALVNGMVTTATFGGGLVVQSGFKRRKLNYDNVREWEEVGRSADDGTATAGAVGKVVAGAVLPGVVGKMASAALDATIGIANRPQRMVRVAWSDQKESLLKRPEDLFTHFAMELRECRTEAAQTSETVEPMAPPPAPLAPPVQADLIEQIAQLAVLRDQGVLTEDEFASKKAELLGRI